MSQSYQDLVKQRETLELAIAQARKNEIAGAVQKVLALVAEFGLTPKDIFPGRSAKAAGTRKVAAKFKNPATQQTWTGRGKAPKWIEGKDRTPFLIG